mgnify:CR=1 FL=1
MTGRLAVTRTRPGRLWQAAWLLDNGKRNTKHASMAKCFAADAAVTHDHRRASLERPAGGRRHAALADAFLRGRELARKRGADLFVSVHADAFNNAQARGGSVYALSQRGATSTMSSKPIVLRARAAAPTLPAWLVLIRMKRVARGLGGIKPSV